MASCLKIKSGFNRMSIGLLTAVLSAPMLFGLTGPAQAQLEDVPVNAGSNVQSVLGTIVTTGPSIRSAGGIPANRQPQRHDNDPLDAAAVRKAIKLGVNYLKQDQLRDGSWRTYRAFDGGTTALATLALVNAGESADSPVIQRSLSQIEAAPRDYTYVVSLRVMALATVDPDGKRYKNLVQRDINWLLEGQYANGSWGYPKGLGDASNSQFAILALHEASKMGIKVPKATWRAARKYWVKLNRDDGFGYRTNENIRGSTTQPRGSMTCAGIASMIIIDEHLYDPEQHAEGEFAKCCGKDEAQDRIDKAFQWLASNYTVRANPRADAARASQLYYLYALERAGRFSGRRFVGPHDWYRDGAKELLRLQKGSGAWQGVASIGEDNSTVATSFALLFLSKGKRPVAIGKFDHGARDWDTHPRGVHYLTRQLEKNWDQKLNWQTVRAENSSVNDLFEAPVLFMSGKDIVGLNDSEKLTLKKYIENGGFLFAEACQGDGCPPGGFELAFKQLMGELFPESELEPLPANHPIWNAHFPLLPNPERPLSGLQACCRTSVVFCPKNLSCYWALGQRDVVDNPDVNPALRNRIRYTQQLGVNVIAYATGRELKEKGETPTVVENKAQLLSDRSLVYPKLNHSGGADDAPNAWKRILEDIRQVSGLEINTQKKMIDPSLEQLVDYPFIFMHGRNQFSFSEDQRAAIRKYLENGGMIFAESICASEAFTNSFRNEIRAILGPGALGEIPADHELWNDPRYGPVLDSVKLRIKDDAGEFKETLTAPTMEGVVFQGRMAVIFSPYDLSCAMENTTVSNCNGYVREDALQIASNIIFYSLRSDANQKRPTP